ncbi:hypothetical protein Ciccas_001495 [Cichlidogyrus casuarinus]|uniref:alkaline phosphatase n=1 Tax=Cichlidogyrus casuarinus TaxID=1844966 RepID=A0ABD2QK04_9PLAT
MLLLIIYSIAVTAFNLLPTERTQGHWLREAQRVWNEHDLAALRAKSERLTNMSVARNTVICLIPGLAMTTLTFAAHVLTNNLMNNSKQLFPGFPVRGLFRTHTLNTLSSDAGAAFSSTLTGVKGFFNTIGTNASTLPNNFEDFTFDNDVNSIVKIAKKAGKTVALVTSQALTHPSVASLYASAPTIHMENDFEMNNVVTDGLLEDFAQQFVHKGAQYFDLTIARGIEDFFETAPREQVGSSRGRRRDNKNLIAEWIRIHHGKFTDDLTLLHTDFSSYGKLLALYSYNSVKTLDYKLLLQNTINWLKKRSSEKGFLLLVIMPEVDFFHKQNNAA